jgi:small subunit ribosomal protein S8
MINDPIGDLIARVKNGQSAHKEFIMAPYSKLKENVLKVLVNEGFIEGYEVEQSENGHKNLKVFLKYFDDKGVIHSIKRVSKPGRRVYSQATAMIPVQNGLGIAIVTTSKGVMTDIQAKKQGLGGEILCNVF